MKIKSIFSATLLVVGLLGMSTSAIADDRVTLGRTILLETSADFGAEVPITMCRRVKGIKIQAKRGVQLTKVEVKYQNGESRTLRSFRHLRKGESSDWRRFIRTRCVSHIKVFGRPTAGSSAGVKVYGLK